MLPLDLHVLSLSLAFILSQDQTLHCTFIFFIRLSLNSSFIVVKILTVVFYYLVLILHFCCFQSFKELFPFLSKRTAKLRHFFELTKYFKKNIYFSFQTSACLTRRQPLSIADAKLLLFLKLPKYFCVFFESFL